MITLKNSELNKLEMEKKATRKKKPAPKVSKPEEYVPPPVDENTLATRELAAAIKSLSESKQDSPDLAGVLSAIEHTQKTQLEILNALGKQKPIERSVENWEFAVERDNKGAIKKIYAKGA